ncbi:MAG: NAD(P)H-binding protein [Balneolales bacterium]|nr:NAD(P)H-binding protein [Balneolales bacterium]
MAKKALIIGATGLTGSHLLAHLLENEAYEKVTAIGRSSCGVTHPKLIEHVFDLNEIKEHAHLFACDTFFCCMGSTIKKAGGKQKFRFIDFTLPVSAARAAFQGGAKTAMLVSSIGANKDSGFFYLKTKGETEQAFSKIGFDRTIIFRPAGLLGKRKEFRLKEKLGIGVMNVFSPLLVGRFRKNRPIEAAHVAYVMSYQPVNHIKGKMIYESDQIQQVYDTMMMGCRVL